MSTTTVQPEMNCTIVRYLSIQCPGCGKRVEQNSHVTESELGKFESFCKDCCPRCRKQKATKMSAKVSISTEESS